MIKLKMLSGALEGQVVELDEEHVTMGRGEQNLIVIDDPDLGEEQCALEKEPAGWVLRDLGSGAPTLLNNEAVREQGAVRNRDEIQIGDLRFMFEETAAPGPPGVSADVIATRRLAEGGIDLSNAGTRVAEAGAAPATSVSKPSETKRAEMVITLVSWVALAAAVVSLAVLFVSVAGRAG